METERQKDDRQTETRKAFRILQGYQKKRFLTITTTTKKSLS